MSNCTAPDCDRTKIVGRGLCRLHYNKWWRANRAANCTFDECAEPQMGRGLCSKHYQRLMAHGSTDKPEPYRPPAGPRADAACPTYNSAHVRVKRWRGYASTHECVDCGEKARDWSYRGGCPDELVDRSGDEKRDGMKYCPHLEHYDPRCYRCHFDHDTERRRYGEKNGNAVLTDSEVRELRQRVAEGESRKDLAREYGVSVSTVHHVVARISWQHVV